MSIKALMEERGELDAKIKKLNDGATGRKFNSEERSEYDKLVERDAAIVELIERQQRLDLQAKHIEERFDDPLYGGSKASVEQSILGGESPSGDDRAVALQGWMRSQVGEEIEDRHQKAMQKCGVRSNQKELELRLGPSPMPMVGTEHRKYQLKRDMLEGRAQTTVVGADGGFLVSSSFAGALELAILSNGGIMNVSSIFRTSTGEPMPWPTANDTANEGLLVGEAVALSEQKLPIGQVVFNKRKISTQLILVSNELMRDSAYNLSSFLGDIMGVRIARRANRMFTTGTGAGIEAQGLVTAATTQVTAALSTSLTLDELINVTNFVDPGYLGNSSYMAHQKTWGALRVLKAGTGQYLWQPSLIPGVPDTFNGYPIVRNNAMPLMATGNKSVTFGDHSKYKIREIGSIRLRQLTERYAEQDVMGFIGFMEYDGALIDAGTHPVAAIAHP